MATATLSLAEQRRLVACWREAGEALARLRRAELASQSAAESRQAAYEMLQLGGMLPGGSAGAERSAGMVEMQRLFACGHGVRRP